MARCPSGGQTGKAQNTTILAESGQAGPTPSLSPDSINTGKRLYDKFAFKFRNPWYTEILQLHEDPVSCAKGHVDLLACSRLVM